MASPSDHGRRRKSNFLFVHIVKYREVTKNSKKSVFEKEGIDTSLASKLYKTLRMSEEDGPANGNRVGPF